MTAPAQPLPLPGSPGLRVLVGARQRRTPAAGAWVFLAVVLAAAFFLLIYSRIALDRSAFVLQEIAHQTEAAEARYWQLRLEAAELQAPERIMARAQELGMVYPAQVEILEVAGMEATVSGPEDRSANIKALLGTQP